MTNTSIYNFLLFFSVNAFVFTSCDSNSNTQKTEQPTILVSPYLNHADSAKYVGMNTCKLCHQDIYNNFSKTGMGQSFAVASSKKTAGNFDKAEVYDAFINMHYTAYLSKDSLYMQEYRLTKKDTAYTRTEKVNFIIGSGQHTNSHIQSVNGYLHQMPMTYYTQIHKWDLPPGFENGVNTRFTRKIGLECMSCHNAYPNFVLGSENKYSSVPQGIDCERCHGPGSIHVALKQSGNIIDTSKYIDYSIVNPSKLAIDLQFDVCQRCHLQGNAVLKNNASFYDYKPGKKLNDYISVFLPKYENADDEFIMASHADRLKQSACFIKSIEKMGTKKTLKPYKEALTCVTCHNPHISVKETNEEKYNSACVNCHSSTGNSMLRCTDKNYLAAHKKQGPLEKLSCVKCHMPTSGSIDIPHVSVHDHFIRKPISKTEISKIKTFMGLYSINEKHPDSLTKAIAYIQQYEKFDQNPTYLDSANRYLNSTTKSAILKNIHSLLKLNFMKANYTQVINYVNILGAETCFKTVFTKVSYDNKDAWGCYHIAESFYQLNKVAEAIQWYEKACVLANYNLDFKLKLANLLAAQKMNTKAISLFEAILNENPKLVSAYTSLGYMYLLERKENNALQAYQTGLKLDPDYEPLLFNLAGYYLYKANYTKAEEIVKEIIQKNSKNTKAKQLLTQIQSLY